MSEFTVDEREVLNICLDLIDEHFSEASSGTELETAERLFEPYLSLRRKILRESHEEINARRDKFTKTPDAAKSGECSTCFGMKYVSRSHGLATERVPCPICNNSQIIKG